MDGSIPQKTCSKCGKTYPATSEYWYKNGLYLRSWCKECERVRLNRYYEENPEYGKRYYEENKEKILARVKRYREENLEKVKGRQKRYRDENAEKLQEYCKRYYEENAEKLQERHKRYYDENAEKLQEYCKRYRDENAEKLREYRRSYREENKEILRANRRNRRARKRNAEGTHTAADIETQVASQTKDGKLYCWWCGKPIKRKYHVDHRIPLAKGGSNDPGNLCITHAKCNLSKHDKMPWEFNGRLL